MQYTYSDAGNLISKTDANGSITCFGVITLTGAGPAPGTVQGQAQPYDTLNRPLVKSYFVKDATKNISATSTVYYAYDAGAGAKGKLTREYNNNADDSFTYDSLGRMSASSQATNGQLYQFGYAYNLAGSLTAETCPSGRIYATQYDGSNRVSSVSRSQDGQFLPYVDNVLYAPQGSAAQYRFGNNLWRAAYNNRLQWNMMDDKLNNADPGRRQEFVPKSINPAISRTRAIAQLR